MTCSCMSLVRSQTDVEFRCGQILTTQGWEPTESPVDQLSFPTGVVGQTGEIHRMDPVAFRPIILCRKTGCTGSCPLSVVEYGYTAGKKPATGRICGKTFPRPHVTLSDFPPARGDEKKRSSSPDGSPAMSLRSSWVSWSDTPREQSAPSGEGTVMEDCTESHQSEINRKRTRNC